MKRKDPTEFRERFKRWKEGELVYENGLVLPAYEDGYEGYLATLPKNQLNSTDYNQRRYWELNDKPKNFSEAVSKGMFTFEPDGVWHAGSVAYNKNTGEYELMKANNHPTRWRENVEYFLNKDFYDNWKLEKSPLGQYGFDKYVPREKKFGLPKYETGKDPDLTPLDLATMYANNKTYGGDRYIDTTMLRSIDNYMIAKGVGLPLRQAIAYTVLQEGNTTKDHGNGAVGLVGWRGNRAAGLSKTPKGQAAKLYQETYGDFNSDNWNHGGAGSGYNSARDAQKAFKTAKTVQDATKALNYGYVRPPLEDRVNRTKNSSRMFKKFEDGKQPRDLEYNSGGDYYYGGKVFPHKELVVTGRRKGLAQKLYSRPWKTYGDIVREQHEEMGTPEERAARAPYEKDLHKPLSPVDPVGELIVGNAVGGPVFNYVGKAASPITSAVTNTAKRKAATVIKPISKYVLGEDIKNRMINSAKDLNWAKKWDDDTSVRWWLNGEKTPDFKFVFHGRGTNRGQAKDVLKNHSYKDVGLHVTESKKTAQNFAKNGGVMYEGVDTGIYPDAIYPDMTMWHAKAWDNIIGPTSKYTKRLIAEEMQQPYMSKAGQNELGDALAFRDLMDNFGISYDDIKNYSRRQLFAGNDELEMEAANKLFANYLKSKGVNFRYKNDFEGGGYNKPSAFVTDLDLIWWSPQHKASNNIIPYDSKKTIDWVNAKAGMLLNPKTNEEWDAAYNAALRSGNINEALRLRDLHFEAKATDNKLKGLFYHGTDKKWNRYNPSYFSSGSGDLGAWGKGLYLSGDKSVAESYGKNIMRLYAYAKSPLEVKPTLEGYLSNPTENAAYYFNRKDIPSNLKPLLKDVDAVNKHGLVFGGGWNFSYKPYEEVVIPKGQQIKSADAITYDDAGNIIPLSKRDNFKINDIRYGLLPIIGATGYGMYNSK